MVDSKWEAASLIMNFGAVLQDFFDGSFREKDGGRIVRASVKGARLALNSHDLQFRRERVLLEADVVRADGVHSILHSSSQECSLGRLAA